jgi:hypothetical protein
MKQDCIDTSSEKGRPTACCSSSDLENGSVRDYVARMRFQDDPHGHSDG